MDVVTQEAASFGPLLVAAGFVLALDQTSKKLVLAADRQLRARRGLTLCIRVHMNRRAVVALLPYRWAVLIWGLAMAASILLIQHAPPFQTWGSRIALGIALGGAAGNLLDAIRRGAVVDFIDLRVWPLFNLADACIVLGVGGTLWSIH
jgi:signal peptidase II